MQLEPDQRDIYDAILVPPRFAEGYIVDFDYIKNLGSHWKRVQIKHIPTYMSYHHGDKHPLAANILGVPIIQEGFAEIAQELVGGEGWVVQDHIEVVKSGVECWLLNANKKPGGEKVQQLNHIGLRSFRGQCKGCDSMEETFNLQPARKDGSVRFACYRCGNAVSPIYSAFDTFLYADIYSPR